MVLTIQGHEIGDQEEQSYPSENLELLVILGIDLAIQLRLVHFLDFFLKGFQGGVRIVRTYVHTVSGGGDLLTHLLVQLRDHHVSVLILHIIIASLDGDRRTFRITHSHDVHVDALLGGGFGGTDSVVLMVLAVGDQDG